MSCPDWRRLDPAARDASGAPHGAADAADAIDALHAVHWREALSHLDSGCPRCWREALAVDPTLIFRRLPAPEQTPAALPDVHAGRRMAWAHPRRAPRRPGAGRGDAGIRSASGLRRRWQDWQAGSAWPALALRRLPAIRSLPSLHAHHVHPARWALAAGLTAMALVYGSGHGWRPMPPIPAAAAPGAPAPAAPAGALASSVSPSTQAGQAGQDMRATSAFAAAAAEPDGPGGQGSPGPRMMPAGWAGASAVQPAASRPSIEGLSRPEARVYQIDSPHMSVVMIVDGKLAV